MSLGSQSRRSTALGQADPRARRGAQGLVNEPQTLAPPVGLDASGRITLTAGRSGDILIRRTTGWEEWDGLPTRPTNIKIAAYVARMGEIVRCNPTAAGFTVSLPPAGGQAGKAIIVKNTSASVNVITIDAAGAELIDGAATATIAAAYAARYLVSDGNAWGVV
jgi:hypothetical protein